MKINEMQVVVSLYYELNKTKQYAQNNYLHTADALYF